MLNAKYYGSGLNLQMTTDLIMYHKMDKNTKIQIIGRAQQVGRNSQLIIHKLLFCLENIINIVFQNNKEKYFFIKKENTIKLIKIYFKKDL